MIPTKNRSHHHPHHPRPSFRTHLSAPTFIDPSTDDYDETALTTTLTTLHPRSEHTSLPRRSSIRNRRLRRNRSPPPSPPSGLDALLAKWDKLRGSARDDDSYYALPFERQRAGSRAVHCWRSTQVDVWLQPVLGRFGVSLGASR
eukprot:6465273-Prymnesium_polylepis.1